MSQTQYRSRSTGVVLPAFWLTLFLVIAVSSVSLAVDYPIVIQRGNGLANVFAKLNSGQSAKIAYIGGSVTENTGWRNNVTSWFNSRYPGKITEISAGWSGTGSLIGAMRLYRDVLAQNPDLVFIEFAVNDLPEDPLSFVERNADGMVRQVFSRNPMTDVCFIETIAYYIEQPYLSGYYPTSVQGHYNVCDYYGVPSVNVGWALYEYVLAGTPWENLAPDRVHPNSAGSQIYSDAVVGYLDGERTRGGASAGHSLRSPKTDFPVTGSNIREMVTISPIPSGWYAHYNEFGVSSFVQSSTAGSTISVAFTGPAAAAKVIVAGDSGEIQYKIDSGSYVSANIPVNGYTFLWAFPVAKTLTNASHTVTFKVISGTARIINVESGVNVSDGMNTSTPGGSNIARSASQWITDSDYSSSYNGSKAIDGVISSTSKWTSTASSATHWLALDLGGDRTVNGYIVRHAGAGGEQSYYNTKYFRIQSSSSINGPWVDETAIDNASQANVTTRSYTTPKTLRYIRLYITNAGTDNYARIPEFEVWGTAPSGMNGNTPTGTNMAPQSTTWQADSNYSTSYNGAKAVDGVISSTSKWVSTGSVATHWLALDLGQTRTVNGFIVRHCSTGGEETYYNTKNFKIQSASSLSGPWSDECTVDNTAQASITTRSYYTPKALRYVRLYITNPGVDNYARIPEFEVWCSGGTSTVSESFETMPGWSSSYDATWGGAASWSIVGGGQSGNALQASRSNTGSSAKALVYSITPNTNYTISIYMKCPSSTAAYWAECAYKLGNNTAQDYDQNASSWTIVNKFSDSGTNGNGNVWTQYSQTFNSGSNTQISVGFKTGNSTGTAPTVAWDTLRIQ